MNRFANSLAKTAAAGLLAAAIAMPGLASAADTGSAPAQPAATQAIPAKAGKAMAGKATAKMHKMQGSAEVKAAQEALNKDGASLTVDGKMGSKTRAALTQYQKSHSLKATGRLDKATRDSLKLS